MWYPQGYGNDSGFYKVTSSGLLNGSESDGTQLLSGNTGMTTGWTTATANVVNNDVAAPDGTTTANRFIEDASNNRHIIFQQRASTDCTVTRHLSVYAKYNNRRYLQLMFVSNVTKKVYAFFDLQTGAVTDSGLIASATSISNVTITAAVNGFYKCEFDCVLGSSSTDTPFFQMALSTTATQAGSVLQFDSPQYAGDNTSNFWLWRPKLT